MRKEPVIFYRDVSTLFGQFAGEKDAILFDSGRPEQQRGRFDILSAWPQAEIAVTDGTITHRDSVGHQQILPDLDAAKSLLSCKWDSEHGPEGGLPFCGGWMGFATYELGYQLEPAAGKPYQPTILSSFWAGYYGWAIIQDHATAEAFLVYEEDVDPALLANIRHRLAARPTPKPFRITRQFEQNLRFDQYATLLDRIHAYLQAGDCYQVNFAMRYHGQYQGDPFTAYQLLRQAVPSPHMAYLNHDNTQILSISPERFIQARGNQIQTRPIKGTAPRFADPEQDRQSSGELATSGKNRAENLMIVDLLRNDLGRHCLPGSIRVEELYGIETYTNVHHLVSTISGRIKPGDNVWDVFFACFPGGSITGAPKIRAAQIIRELEQYNREIYCGALFYASNHGRFDSSIAIRTLLCHAGDIFAWAGGGIVVESIATDEYRECLDKIGSLLKSLEANGSPPESPEHQQCPTA